MLWVLKAAIAALIFAVGTNATAADIAWLWRRPVLLLKSLLAMYVVAPLAAVAMARMLELPRPTEVALVVLAVCAGAPLLPKKLIDQGGDPPFVFSLVVATSLFAIVTVPASLHPLRAHLSFDPEVSPPDVAALILKSLLLPLGSGMLTRAVAPRAADRGGDLLLKMAGVVLAVAALLILIRAWRQIVELGLPSLAAFAAFTLIALSAGHWLGGPEASHRTTLAVACVARHVGLALLVAANAPGARALALVATYLLASTLVSVLYLRWRANVHPLGPP